MLRMEAPMHSHLHSQNCQSVSLSVLSSVVLVQDASVQLWVYAVHFMAQPGYHQTYQVFHRSRARNMVISVSSLWSHPWLRRRPSAASKQFAKTVAKLLVSPLIVLDSDCMYGGPPRSSPSRRGSESVSFSTLGQRQRPEGKGQGWRILRGNSAPCNRICLDQARANHQLTGRPVLVRLHCSCRNRQKRTHRDARLAPRQGASRKEAHDAAVAAAEANTNQRPPFPDSDHGSQRALLFAILLGRAVSALMRILQFWARFFKQFPVCTLRCEVVEAVHGNNKLSGNFLLDCVVGVTGAKYRLGNKVKATSVKELSGKGLSEKVGMSMSAGEDTMDSASALAKSADCMLEAAQCSPSFSSSLQFSVCSFPSSFLPAETVVDPGCTTNYPLSPEECPRRCGGSSLSDFGSHVFPGAAVTWLTLSSGGRAGGGSGDLSLQARPFRTMSFSIFFVPHQGLRVHSAGTANIHCLGRGVMNSTHSEPLKRGTFRQNCMALHTLHQTWSVEVIRFRC